MSSIQKIDFKDGEDAETVINRELLGKMLTSEFQIEGFIPFNVSLVVRHMDQLSEDLLGIDLTIHKELEN
jgi:hypothetical protein